MATVLQQMNNISEPIEIYNSSHEYLLDELRRLDILIQLRFLKQKMPQSPNLLDQLKGLILSEAEIQDLFVGESDENLVESKSLNAELTFLESQIDARRKKSIQQGKYLSLPFLASIFNLTPFEEDVIVICLAPELDRKYEKFYAYLQDDVTRKSPSIDLIMTLLLHTFEERVAARLAFEPQAPLSKYVVRFIDLENSQTIPFIARFLKLDDRIVNFLLDINQTDQRIEPFVKRTDTNRLLKKDLILSQSQERFCQMAKSLCQMTDNPRPKILFYLHGSKGAGKKRLAEKIGSELELPLLTVDLMKAVYHGLNADIWQVICREVVLQQAVLILDNFQILLESSEKNQMDLASLIDVLRRFVPVTFIISDQPWNPAGTVSGLVFIEEEIAVPSETHRQIYWEKFSKPYSFNMEIDFTSLAGKFKFTAGQILNSLETAAHLAVQHQNFQGQIGMRELYTACHQQSNQKLNALAQKIKPKYHWQDIVLPADQTKLLQEICNQVKYRHVVYNDWGFDNKLSLGKGLNALFSGPPGTGKTMAAEVIANELELELYKIDLSQIVSKYIGETEKNLAKIFTEAQTSNSILFFDEADALFGKRSEVKDAHDRYANIETGYLLQKMEEYEGIVILATNLNKNMDEAFLRRMQFIIEFPFPDIEQRDEMWRKIFPSNAPLAQDLNIQFLAERLRITGGNIKNIALSAAFYAAKLQGQIGMKEIMQAAKKEYRKIGKAFLESDFEPYSELIKEN